MAAKPVRTKTGKPNARVSELGPLPARRVPGIDKGQLQIANDFDSMSKSELDEWYGSSVLPSPINKNPRATKA